MLLEGVTGDQKRFLRNRAFDLVRELVAGGEPDAASVSSSCGNASPEVTYMSAATSSS